MSFSDFLQFLNLPIFAGVAYVIYKSGRVVQSIESHEQRIGILESRSFNFYARRKGESENVSS